MVTGKAIVTNMLTNMTNTNKTSMTPIMIKMTNMFNKMLACLNNLH